MGFFCVPPTSSDNTQEIVWIKKTMKIKFKKKDSKFFAN